MTQRIDSGVFIQTHRRLQELGFFEKRQQTLLEVKQNNIGRQRNTTFPISNNAVVHFPKLGELNSWMDAPWPMATTRPICPDPSSRIGDSFNLKGASLSRSRIPVEAMQSCDQHRKAMQ